MDMQLVTVELREPKGGYVKLQGTEDMIGRLLSPYLKGAEFSVEAIGAVEEKEAPALDQNASVSNASGEITIPSDLIGLYRKTKPTTQNEEVLVIVFHFKRNKNVMDVNTDDIENGYKELRFVPVKPPTTITKTVRNTVNRTEWLRNTERGRYAITLVGEEYVAEMLSR